MTIILSDRQLEAKEKLEKSLQKTHRNWFSSYDEFSEYMQILIKQINRKIKLNNAVKEWKISYAEINQKHKEKVIKYYNNFDKLKNYGIKYSQKYFPSYKKLLNKLIEKSKNEELSLSVLEYLMTHNIQLTDKILIDNYFNNYLLIWKNYNKIKELLTKKWFEKSDIDNKINKSKDDTQWSLLDPFILTKKIERLLKSWKSEFYIKNKLADTKYDLELINEILLELNFDNKDVMIKEINKLKNKNLDKQKIIQRMFSKWYNYDDFKYLI